MLGRPNVHALIRSHVWTFNSSRLVYEERTKMKLIMCMDSPPTRLNCEHAVETSSINGWHVHVTLLNKYTVGFSFSLKIHWVHLSCFKNKDWAAWGKELSCIYMNKESKSYCSCMSWVLKLFVLTVMECGIWSSIVAVWNDIDTSRSLRFCVV